MKIIISINSMLISTKFFFLINNFNKLIIINSYSKPNNKFPNSINFKRVPIHNLTYRDNLIITNK